MSDEAIKKAVQERERVRTKIASLDRSVKRAKSQLSEIEKFISQWEKFSGLSAETFEAKSGLKSKENSENEGSEVLRNPLKEDVTEAAYKILKEVGTTLSRSDLFNRLKERNIVLRGKNPEMVLSTMLWRTRNSSGITRLKGGGYCLGSGPINSLADQFAV